MPNKLINKYKALPKQVKASIWFLACSFLQKGISVLTTPIFTRLMSTAEYGSYNVFNSWYSIVIIFVSLNLYAGVYTQGLVKFDKERDVFSSALQGLSLVLVVGWTVIYLCFQNFWNSLFSLSTPQMLLMLLMVWTSGAFSFWAAEQRVKLNYRKLVLLTIIASVLKPVVGIIFVTNAEDKVLARIVGLALVEVICYSGCFIIQVFRGKKFFYWKYWKYSLAFNLPLIPHYLSQTVLNNADRIMIGKMVSDSAAGVYSLAYSLALLMTLFNTALSQTLSPWIYQKIKDRLEDDIPPIVYSSISIIAVVNLLLIVFAPEAVAIFAPVEYYDAIWIIPPVAMSTFFMFMYDIFAKFEFYHEKTGFVAIASSIGALLNIILNYVFIRLYGYYAAGYTTLFCYIMFAVFHYIFMNRVCENKTGNSSPFNIKVILLLSIGFMVAGFGFMALYNYTIIRYAVIVTALIIAIIYRNRIKSIITSLLSVRKTQDK